MKIKILLLEINKRPRTVAITIFVLILYTPVFAIWDGKDIDSLREWFQGGVPVILFLDLLYNLIPIKKLMYIILLIITLGFIYLIYKVLKQENLEIKDMSK